jgi:hypothetical protein
MLYVYSVCGYLTEEKLHWMFMVVGTLHMKITLDVSDPCHLTEENYTQCF